VVPPIDLHHLDQRAEELHRRGDPDRVAAWGQNGMVQRVMPSQDHALETLHAVCCRLV
jgi:hypothetical protein